MITSPSPNKNGPEKSNPIQQWLRWERTPPNITETPFYPTTAIIQNFGPINDERETAADFVCISRHRLTYWNQVNYSVDGEARELEADAQAKALL